MLQELQELQQPQEPHAMAATMLTAQQVQDLLDVDASTIYRMAGDGRLPAVRIGRQWRFPAEAIQALLVPARTSGASATPASATPPAPASSATAAASVVPTELATAALEAIAPALGVTMVVTDLDGHALTPIVNPAPAIADRIDDPDFATACAFEWRGFAHEPHLAPRLQPGRFGFLCAHSLVRRGPELVAMVLAGGIAPDHPSPPDAAAAPADGLFHLDAARRELVLQTLPRTAALLSQVLTTRSSTGTAGAGVAAPATT